MKTYLAPMLGLLLAAALPLAAADLGGAPALAPATQPALALTPSDTGLSTFVIITCDPRLGTVAQDDLLRPWGAEIPGVGRVSVTTPSRQAIGMRERLVLGLDIRVAAPPPRDDPQWRPIMDKAAAALTERAAKLEAKLRAAQTRAQEPLRKAVREFETERQQLAPAQAEAAKRLEVASATFEKAQAAADGMNHEEAATQQKAMRDESRRLQMDLLGKRARREAIEKALVQARMEAEDRLGGDKILPELEKIVSARAEQLKLVEEAVRIGRATQAEVTAAQAAVAEAKVQVLQRREAVVQGAAGEVLQRLRSELLMLTVDAAELEARAAMTRREAEKAGAVVRAIEEVSQAQTQVQQLARRPQEITQTLASLQEVLNAPPPAVEFSADLPPDIPDLTLPGGRPGRPRGGR